MPDFKAERKESGVFYLRFLVMSLIWVVALAIVLPVALYAAPDIEARMWPVLKQQLVSGVHFKPDDDTKLRWSWSFLKNRYGYPEYIAFMAWADAKPESRFPVEIFTDWDCQRSFRTDRTSLAGNYTERLMCVDLPQELAGRRDVNVAGYAEYRVGHILYTVPVRIPTARLGQ